MKLSVRVGLLFAAAVTFPFAARGQYAVAGSFTAQHITLSTNSNGTANQSAWVYGPTFSVQHERGHFVKFGFDARGSFLTGSNVGVRSFDVGPRLAITPRVLPIKVFGEVLIGGIGVRPRADSAYTTHFDLQEVVGVDYTLIPHVDWRVLEFAHGNVLGLGGLPDEDTRNQLSSGIVVRF
jgi:hypothetical protein